MNQEQIAKLKELALKAIEKAPWPFYLTAFHREATPENILELIAEAERALLAAAPAPIQQAPQATLICPTCGKDRFKEPCPSMADECPMIADAHLLAPPALAGSQVQAAGDAVQTHMPKGLIERIKAAEQRIEAGHSLRRIPADPTDVDLVLAEVRLWLEGRHDKAIWIKPNADCSGEPANCPDNEGYGCACDQMNKAAMREHQT